jgi:signal transduction histidine kinase/CheY-like chemotaxis protein
MAVFSARAADIPVFTRLSAVQAAALAGFCVGLLILLGWQFDVGFLKSGLPGQRATQPLTAVCLCLSSLSLGLSSATSLLYRVTARASAALVMLFVLATLCQNALDTDWGLDRLLFTDAVVHEQTGPFLRPGRPAGASLVGFALLTLCLLLTEARTALATRLYVALATTGALFSATALLAYLFSLRSLYAMGLYAHVGLLTGLALGIQFVGALFRRSDLGWMRILTGDTVGGASARHLLGWSVALLVVLAGIVQLGSAHALYGAELEVTLVTLAGIGLLFAGVVTHAERVDLLEGERRSVARKLRSVEEELELAGRSKDAFVSVLAHELRNPLASLRNGVEIVRRTSPADGTRSHTAEMMSRQMNQLVRLVDDLLDISRIARGTLQLSRQRVLLSEVVECAVDSSREAIASKGHRLTVIPGDARVAVEGDFHRLAQVVGNVLANSARHTEPGGCISIEIAQEGSAAVIRVCDTGTGIPPEALEANFDTFSQLRADHAQSGGGLGVGLALVRSIVHLHGGAVAAHSTGAGAGSCFTIQLPAAAGAGLSEAPAGSVPASQPASLRILVADDNTDAAASLAMLLRLEGHEVQTAVDGVQAIELAERMRPDVIFLDVGMPRLGGIEAARRIRALPWGPTTRIVALTGWGQESDSKATLAGGVDLHLLKPVDPSELALILRSIGAG